MTAIQIPTEMAVYIDEKTGRQRLWIQFDQTLAERYFSTLPAYVKLFGYTNGSLGCRFTIDRNETNLSRRSRGATGGKRWAIEKHGLQKGGSAETLGRMLGIHGTEYGMSPTTALFFPRGGTILRIHQPKFSDRVPVDRKDAGADQQSALAF